MIQTSTAFIIIQYYSYRDKRFIYTNIIIINTLTGFQIRIVHINIVRRIFIVLYLHIGKGLFYSGWKMIPVWFRGLTLLILIIIVSFFAYTLPSRRIRFWGVTVIFNLLTVLPGGVSLVYWLWSGFYVNSYTIGFIFSLHFLLPFVILLIVIFHILYLHQQARTNVLAFTSTTDKVNFYPLYLVQDILNVIVIWVILLLIITFPFYLIDREIMVKINMIISPLHIQPEWYFLPFYSILRVIPRKVGGVMCFAISILIFFTLPFLKTEVNHLINWKLVILSLFFWNFLLLIWTAIKPIEYPYKELGLLFSLTYFALILML